MRPRPIPLRTMTSGATPRLAEDMGSILPLVWFADVEVNLEANDFVEGLLTDGAMSVVYGESNSGKTFWASDLAMPVAAGKPWRGRDIRQGAVVYCALEGGHGIRNRVAAWRHHHGMEDARIPFAVVPVQINMLDPTADAENVIATIKHAAEIMEIPARLVVFDTLSRALSGGNENAPDDMGALVMNGDRVRHETGAHTLWVHHSGKDQARGARGHSLLRAATDTEIEIIDNGGLRSATVVKQRDLEGGQVFNFRLEAIALGQNARGKDVTSCVAIEADGLGQASGDASGIRRRKLASTPKRALQVLADLIAERGETGFRETPCDAASVPEKWWRERFYERAMPADDQETKKRAFRRAADVLIAEQIVGFNLGRVWLA